VEQQLKLDLQKQFDDANLELEEMKAKNASLEGDITKYQGDLKAQKARIESLLGDSRNLKKAREELESLKASYANKIAELTAQIDQLTAANATLTTEKTQLQTDLSAEKTARQEVVAQKEQVTAEKTKVEEERTNLSKKVDVASLVRVSDITAVGFNVKDSGKEVKKNYAKNIERLKVCISLGQNDIVAAGRETFQVRIITPTGESLSTPSQGGGVLKTNKGE
jgi:chromosome segregation ATPase